MKHPNDEQWSEFLYGEAPARRQREIQGHLKACPACREKWQTLQGTLKQLDAWKLDMADEPQLPQKRSPLIKWAAAAALLVSTAFATGRFSKSGIDEGELQARISRPLEQKIDREMQARLENQVALATEKALEAIRSNLETQFAAQLKALEEKAAVSAASDKEQLALALTTLRDQDKAIYHAVQEIERKRETDYRALRQDLEKVALFTDQNLRNAQRQLVQLASFSEKTSQ